jgi:hypothetical protein
LTLLRLSATSAVIAAILACGGGPEPRPADPTPAAAEPAPNPAPNPATPSAGAGRCAQGLRRIDFWAGEYPSPVIQVDRQLSVPARRDPCAPAPDTTCALAPGLYHPWADRGEYITLRAPERYRASVATALDESVQVDAGEEIEVITYLSEGYCSFLHRGRQVEAPCPGVGDDALARVSAEPPPPIQLFTGGCGAWVDADDALFQVAGVRQGEITGYGEIGRAP